MAISHPSPQLSQSKNRSVVYNHLQLIYKNYHTSIPQGSVAVSIILFKSLAIVSLSDSSSDRVLVPKIFLE